MNNYEQFLESKQKTHIFSGFDIDENELNKKMFPFQKFITMAHLPLSILTTETINIHQRVAGPSLCKIWFVLRMLSESK